MQLRQFIENSESSQIQKRIEHQKLNSLIGYVEAIHCRRTILLEYFGEESSHKCNNCDNCTEPPITYDATTDSQKVLSCIYRTQTERYGFGVGHIINILLGKADEKVKSFQHDKLSTFGIGADVKEAQWRSIIRQLVILGYIEIDMQYSSLRTNAKTMEILKTGGEKVELRKYLLESKGKTKRIKVGRTSLTENNDIDLFNELKQLRLSIARKENMPPYIVFTDKSLLEMVDQKPNDLAEMANISGVGQHKLNKYGEEFLEVVKKHKN